MSPAALAPDRAARAVVADPGPPPPPSPLALPARERRQRAPRSELIPSGDGTYRAEDLAFTARVGRDGRVTIEDRPNLRVKLGLPGAGDIAGHLNDWAEDPYGTATKDERAIETRTVKILEGSFDVTDWIMRAAGQDPYLQRKALFLDRTRDQRARLAEAERTRLLIESLDRLPAFLVEIWSDPTLSAAQRRLILFTLWDDCAERGPDELVRAAGSARATILAFIRRTLPADSEHAYTADELRTLDRTRRSSQPFAPYSTP